MRMITTIITIINDNDNNDNSVNVKHRNSDTNTVYYQ